VKKKKSPSEIEPKHQCFIWQEVMAKRALCRQQHPQLQRLPQQDLAVVVVE